MRARVCPVSSFHETAPASEPANEPPLLLLFPPPLSAPPPPAANVHTFARVSAVTENRTSTDSTRSSSSGTLRKVMTESRTNASVVELTPL